MPPTDPSLDTLRSALGPRYDIERLLGRGGMGAVYLARDTELDRPVAIKVLPQEFASVPDLRERFLRETRTAASFSHPNIVPVFAIEDRPGLLAFVMGYVEGESVAERVRRAGPLSVRELARLLQDVGYALAYAHGRGVVHRDIKPDNIMLERATGRALLMDFGISRTMSTAPAAAQGLTRVGEVVGTPEFMSPEQASGDTLTGRSDLYSLGLVAWFAATGRLAISGDSTQKIIVRQITETIPAVRSVRADLPDALAAAVDRCLLKDPDDRFASAESLVDTLDAAQLTGPEIPLPIRMFSEEASQVLLVLIGGVVLGALLYSFLERINEFDLDLVLLMILYSALLWARLTQPFPLARTLVRRGFPVPEIRRGMAAVMSERDDARAQLRADTAVVSRRRRQIILSVLALAASYLVYAYVLRYQRREIRPGVNAVFPLGVRLLYAVYVTSGIAIVGLLRSPFRRPLSEWFFKWFWLGWPGTAVLALASRGIPAAGGAPVTFAGVARVDSAGAAASTPVAADVETHDAHHVSRIDALERRVEALEQGTNRR